MKYGIVILGLALVLPASSAWAKGAEATRLRSSSDLILPYGRQSVVGQHVLIERVVEAPVVVDRVVERTIVVEKPVERTVERVVERTVPGPERIVERVVPGPERIRVIERTRPAAPRGPRRPAR